MYANEDELEDEFQVGVRRSREMIERGKRHQEQTFWRYVGLVGAIGWSIILPMLIGGAIGLWMDKRGGGGYGWGLGLMLLGLALGCLNAWRTVTREMEAEEEEW